jgi:GNAT superfamily N-acetyltransferase
VAEIVVHRVTDAAGAAPCEELYREYVGWVTELLRTVHGFIPTEPDAVAHDEFRAEYPKLFGQSGRMVLVTVDAAPAAVGALKPLSDRDSELKRMYVRPAFRGLGIGRRLIDYLIGEARELGYHTMRLDTLDFMTEARALYRSVGFVDRPPYAGETLRHRVDAHALFMALDLTTR